MNDKLTAEQREEKACGHKIRMMGCPDCAIIDPEKYPLADGYCPNCYPSDCYCANNKTNTEPEEESAMRKIDRITGALEAKGYTVVDLHLITADVNCEVCEMRMADLVIGIEKQISNAYHLTCIPSTTLEETNGS